MAIGEYRRERYSGGSGTGGTRSRTIVWGAVIAGVILAIAIQLMLGLLGLGLGFGGLPGTDRSVTALASAAGIYSLIAALVGLFIGAFATARFAGLSEKVDSILHGLVTWAVATLLVVVVLGGTASSVLGGAFGAVGASVEGLSTAASNLATPVSTGPSLPASVAADLRALSFARSESAAQEATGEDPESGDAAAATQNTGDSPVNFSAIAAALSETASDEERQAAVTAIQELGGLSQPAAEQRLAGYQQSFDEMVRTARQTADDAARSVAAAAFSAFVALLLGAIVSIAGGFLGRSRAERA
ncbi:hypothetical protein [Fulvimarina sp. MAC8]|uniref:hypothetical protein n=1 Tax=Fulvimarina sp. MAC8 TaxID=3162874 RepID=UPI0032F02BE6